MKNFNKLKYCISLAALTFPLNAGAISCTTPPSCETLGYNQNASDCSGQYMLQCPFDSTKVFCGGCTKDFNLTQCDATKGVVENCYNKCKYTSCYFGWVMNNGDCVPRDCGAGYGTNKGCIGSISVCKTGKDQKYKCSECRDCYELKDGQCHGKHGFQIKMASFPYETGKETCTFNGTVYTRVTACAEGRTLCTTPSRSECITGFCIHRNDEVTPFD